MHSFNSDLQSTFYLRGHDIDKNGADFTEILQSAGNGIDAVDSADISRVFSMYNGIKASSVSVVPSSLKFGPSSLKFGGIPNSAETRSAEKGQLGGGGGVGKDGHFENWGDSRGVADRGDRPPDNGEINQLTGVGLFAGDSTDQSKGKFRDQKELLKLAQNREAARKSRIRKKAYVQQLESSQRRLLQLDQVLKRERQQVGSRICGEQRQSSRGLEENERRWIGEHERLMDDLRASLRWDEEGVLHQHHHLHLRLLVDAAVSHYGELLQMKARWDVFHIMSGMWRTPVERWLMWLGGFRSSELLTLLERQIQPLSVQQLVGIWNLQQSCLQSEDALSQGVEALHHSLLHTVSSTLDYMPTAITNIQTIHNFLNQADLLRLRTLQQLQRILSPSQAARALLAINGYKSKLRALSSLWLARPKE